MTTVGGYSSDSEFLQMDHKKFVDYCAGLATIAIGANDFRGAIYTIISMSHARGMKRQIELDEENRIQAEKEKSRNKRKIETDPCDPKDLLAWVEHSNGCHSRDLSDDTCTCGLYKRLKKMDLLY
jgi:hypothetical protein